MIEGLKQVKNLETSLLNLVDECFEKHKVAVVQILVEEVQL